VSVGMLFNPTVITEQWDKVLLVVLIIIAGKGTASFLLVYLFRYPLKTGLLVSSGLAQIGEFSFILVSLGLAHGLLPPEGRDLVLAGALISIALNPLVFYMSFIFYECVGRHPRLARFFNMRDDNLSYLGGEERSGLKDLVILIGHGRVGKHVGRNIQDAHIDLVVIDSNRERVEALRAQGYHAIAGDATHERTLREAAIDQATAIAIAVPDPFEARRILETARAINPNIRVLVRVHNDQEQEYFESQGVDLVLHEPREVGRRMVEYLNNLRTMDATA